MLKQKGLLFFFLALTFLGSGLFLLFIYQQGKSSTSKEKNIAINNALKGKIMHSLGSEAKIVLSNQDINNDGLIEAVGILPLPSAPLVSKDSFYCKHLEIYHLPGRKVKRLIAVEPHSLFDAEDVAFYSFIPPYVGYFCKVLPQEQGLVAFEFTKLDVKQQKTDLRFLIHWDSVLRKYKFQLLN
jgi:hypothetical protein